MRRTVYWIGYFAALVLLLLGVLIARVMIVAGVFAKVEPRAPGLCIALPGVIGAEDLQIDRANHLLFASATDRRAKPDKPDPQDGLYLLDLGNKAAGFVRLTPPSPAFHPQGLSLYTAYDGTRTLMVVNHPSASSSEVDIFDVVQNGGGIALHQRGEITSTSMIALNDLIAVGPNRFYAANQTTHRSTLLATLDYWILRPSADILYYNGTVIRLAAKDLTLAAGIAVAPDYSHIYVSDSLRRKIVTFTGNPLTGELTKVSEEALPAVPDKIDVNASGNLWVAGQLKLLKRFAYRTNAQALVPSAIYELPAPDGLPERPAPIYVNNGEQIGAAGVGAAFNGHLYIGSIYDSKILDCALASNSGG